MKNLLGSREIYAKPGIERVAKARGLELSYATKLSACIEINKSSLGEEDHGYAARASLDFVFMNAESTPVLAVEVDASCKDEIGRHQARRKDAIAHSLGFPLIRLDIRDMQVALIDAHVESVISQWFNESHPEAHDPQALFSSKISGSDLPVLAQEFESNAYRTTHKVNARSFCGNIELTFYSYATVTIPGGITHDQVAALTSAAKLQPVFNAIWG